MPGDQMRAAAADAITCGTFLQRGNDRRVIGQAEIVIAAEGHQIAVAEALHCLARTFPEQLGTDQPLPFMGIKLLAQALHEFRRSGCCHRYYIAA